MSKLPWEDNKNAKESQKKKEDQKAENHYRRSFPWNSSWFCSTTGSSREGADAFCA